VSYGALFLTYDHFSNSTRDKNSHFRHQSQWSWDHGLLLPLSNSYSTHASISQQVIEVSALHCITHARPLLNNNHRTRKQSALGNIFVWRFLFWSTEHVPNRRPLVSGTPCSYCCSPCTIFKPKYYHLVSDFNTSPRFLPTLLQAERHRLDTFP
jgi:hypothetical protein